jgi:hypothetical protein
MWIAYNVFTSGASECRYRHPQHAGWVVHVQPTSQKVDCWAQYLTATICGTIIPGDNPCGHGLRSDQFWQTLHTKPNVQQLDARFVA